VQALESRLIKEPFAKFVVGRSLFGSRVVPPESVKDPVTLNPFVV
jgi:hypothetical protein